LGMEVKLTKLSDEDRNWINKRTRLVTLNAGGKKARDTRKRPGSPNKHWVHPVHQEKGGPVLKSEKIKNCEPGPFP